MSVNYPYRAPVARPLLEAPTALGMVTLLIEPRQTRLEIGPQVWTIRKDHLRVETHGNRRRKTKSMMLAGSQLWVAKAWPTDEISLWVRREDGSMQRLLGLPPVAGLDHRAIEGWRALERLADRLQEALSFYAHGESAFELGRGRHRVLSLRYPDRIVVYARPIFREYAQRVVEVLVDGTVLLPRRNGRIRKIPMNEGVEFIASGDRICFCKPDGLQTARIFFPWLSAADRSELTWRFQRLVGHAMTPPKQVRNRVRNTIGFVAPVQT